MKPCMMEVILTVAKISLAIYCEYDSLLVDLQANEQNVSRASVLCP